MIELKKMIQGSFLFDELMSKHTSYGIGGPAKAYITPKNKSDLELDTLFANIIASAAAVGSSNKEAFEISIPVKSEIIVW